MKKLLMFVGSDCIPHSVPLVDIGFRVEGLMTDEAGTSSGSLVIRINGEWIEVSLGGGMSPAR